jgi:hypothetical protein
MPGSHPAGWQLSAARQSGPSGVDHAVREVMENVPSFYSDLMGLNGNTL